MAVSSRPATTEVDASKVDVLVVDHDAAVRGRVMELLQQEGWVSAGAANGAEALRLARDRAPRLILLDLELPVMTGWQFLERRRSDRSLARVPVVIVGGLDPGRHDVAGRLDKPVDEARMIALVRSLLSPPRPSILLVEDDADTRQSVGELLEEAGYRVTRAANGAEAEAHLLGPRPDCIVLDLWMPVMDGWHFTDRVQQVASFDVPIVVITAAEPHWGYPVPLAHVVRKPIHPTSFLATIERVIGASRGDPSRSAAQRG